MIFHENPLLADNSHETYLIFFQKLGQMSQNLSSAAVMIGALRGNGGHLGSLLYGDFQRGDTKLS